MRRRKDAEERPVDEPQRHARGENQIHRQGEVTRRARFPDPPCLRDECDRGQRAGDRADEIRVHAWPFFFSSSRNRSTRRCTFPVVVIGRLSVNSISLGYSYVASLPRTCCCSSASSAAEAWYPGVSTMNAFTMWVRSGAGLPTTAQFATAGCFTRQFSISEGPMR